MALHLRFKLKQKIFRSVQFYVGEEVTINSEIQNPHTLIRLGQVGTDTSANGSYGWNGDGGTCALLGIGMGNWENSSGNGMKRC